MDYPHQVYHFSELFPRFGFALMPLLMVAAGIGIYRYYKRLPGKGADTSKIHDRKSGIRFAIFFASFTGLVSIFSISSSLAEYFKTKSVFTKKQYQITEGIVEHYYPMPYGGHDAERFTVNGVDFEFSDFDMTDYGYNNTSSHGGVIREGLK